MSTNKKTNLTQTVISFKKLSGVANTSMFKTELGETIASNVQIGTNVIFGQTPPVSPPTTMYETSSGVIVQRVEFDLVPIIGTTYIATDADSQAESSTSTTHSFALKLKSNYETLGSDNPKVGTPPFINNYYASGSGGTLQFVPPSFGLDYLVVLKDQNGVQITTGDIMDWYFDYYSGILFRQDGDNTTIPTSGSGYIYIGKYANEVIASGSGGSGNGFPFSGSAVITGSLTVSGSGITVNGGAITLTSSSITSTSSSISFTTGSITITSGSITVGTGSFVGNLTGTASYATIANASNTVFVAGLSNDITVRPLFTVTSDGNNAILFADANNGITYKALSNTLNIGSFTDGIPTGSINLTGSLNILSGSITIASGSLIGTSSFALSASNAINAQNAISAQTASYVNTLNQNVTINGDLSAHTGSFNVLQVNYISSSIIYSSGSNTFGDELSDTQILSGSVYVVGPNFTWNGSKVITSADTGSMSVLSASYASTATSADSATSASYALSSSYTLNATNANSATSASYALSSSSANSATSASYALSSSYTLNAASADSATSASYALNATSADSATSASYALNATSADSATSASYALNATSADSATSASYALSSSYTLNATNANSATSASYALNATSADSATSASYALNATNATNASTASYVNTLNQDVTINGTTSTTDLTVTNNATITGNLTVNGTTTYVNVQDLLIEDKFILLNSGSKGGVPNEGGIIVQTTTIGGEAYGTALYYDQENNRWVVNRSGSVAWNATNNVFSTSSDFIVTVTGSAGVPIGTPVNFGTGDSLNSIGQMYINTSNSDIYIYA
jgi:hypothetical protein